MGEPVAWLVDTRLERDTSSEKQGQLDGRAIHRRKDGCFRRNRTVCGARLQFVPPHDFLLSRGKIVRYQPAVGRAASRKRRRMLTIRNVCQFPLICFGLVLLRAAIFRRTGPFCSSNSNSSVRAVFVSTAAEGFEWNNLCLWWSLSLSRPVSVLFIYPHPLNGASRQRGQSLVNNSTNPRVVCRRRYCCRHRRRGYSN